MPNKKNRRNASAQQAKRTRNYSDQQFPKPKVPWFGNPRIIIAIGIVVIVSFIALPLFSVFGGVGTANTGGQPSHIGGVPVQGAASTETSSTSVFTQPTFTPIPEPTPRPTAESKEAEATPEASPAPGP